MTEIASRGVAGVRRHLDPTGVRRICKALLVWFTVSLVYGAIWVHYEGWVMLPAPTHWWWWALSGWMSGFGARPVLDAWLARRRMRRLQRDILSWSEARR